MKNLQEIITALKQIRTDTKTKVSDEVLWDSAVRIFNSQNINRKGVNDFKPATTKQKDFLKTLGVEFNENISRLEAKRLIKNKLDEIKKNSSNEKNGI